MTIVKKNLQYDRNEGIDMKRCPNCKRIYYDNDFYCLNDNYPLVKLDEENLTNSKKRNNTIRCPKCRKMINEKDRKCCYCGFDGISYYISLLRETEGELHENSSTDNNSHSDSGTGCGIGYLVLIVIICVGLTVSICNIINRDEKCKVCNGTGYYQKKTCVFCNGTGKYNPDKDPYKSYKELYGD